MMMIAKLEDDIDDRFMNQDSNVQNLLLHQEEHPVDTTIVSIGLQETPTKTIHQSAQ